MIALIRLPRKYLITMIAICLSTSSVMGQESQSQMRDSLVFASHRTCFFADDEANIALGIVDGFSDVPNGKMRVDWSLATGVRTLRRGTAEARSIGGHDEKQALVCMEYVVVIPTPPLRPSVVLPVELRTTWAGGRKKYKLNESIYLFSSDPFSTRQTLLGNAQIKLFDADGKTAELLDKHEIPHSRLINLSAIDHVTEGIVIVGEGVSFREQRKLAESLFRVAQRGVPVLCLAPSEGAVSLEIRSSAFPQEGEPIRPSRLVLKRGEVVRRYDKRFDEIPAICNLSLESCRNEVVISDAKGHDDWSWLDLEFLSEETPKPRGRLIVCGLGIVAHWERSPVPRYLFVHLIEELTRVESTVER